MVASALLIVLMLVVVKTLVSCNSYVRNAETKVQAQTQAMAASIWVSRSLAEASISATCTTTFPPDPASGVSFPSPRDPASGDVNWSKVQGGALVWRQIKFCYLENSTSTLVVRGFPLYYAGSTPTVDYFGNPANPGVVDLPGGQILTSAIVDKTTPPDRVIAQNIRTFSVTVYPANAAAAQASSANITVESYAPYYGVNYGIRVVTGVRMQN